MSDQHQTEQTSSTTALPSHARVVIIGGGAVGCSIAWHLGREGWSDVVLLKERADFRLYRHAAGNCLNYVGS